MNADTYEPQVPTVARCIRDFIIARYELGVPYLQNFYPNQVATFAKGHPEYQTDKLLTSSVLIGRFLVWMINVRPEFRGRHKETKRPLYARKGFCRIQGYTGGRNSYRIFPSMAKKIYRYVETKTWQEIEDGSDEE